MIRIFFDPKQADIQKIMDEMDELDRKSILKTNFYDQCAPIPNMSAVRANMLETRRKRLKVIAGGKR